MQLHPYKERHHELSVEQGCILWGMRVIDPDFLRAKVLAVAELHETRPGMCRMKALARSFVWCQILISSLREKWLIVLFVKQ